MKQKTFKPVKAWDIRIGNMPFAISSNREFILWTRKRYALERAAQLDPEYEAEVVPVLITPIQKPQTKTSKKRK